MTFSTDNYSRPTPWLLKLIADLGLLVAGIAEILPEFQGKQWVVAGAIGFKFITKFISEHPRPIE